jgi:hypothetical protein
LIVGPDCVDGRAIDPDQEEGASPAS